MTDPTRVYTDGACRGNPGPGGWAWAVAPDGEPCGSGGEAHSTNQRMEVRAALEAMRSLPGELTVVSDSTYVVNCIRNRWYAKWLTNGWVNSQKKAVANVDLWKPFIDLYLSRRDEIGFEWVKGHSGNPMNDLVDRLAVVASAGPFDAIAPAQSSAAQSSLFDE
jgi:ribonuclease HI